MERGRRSTETVRLDSGLPPAAASPTRPRTSPRPNRGGRAAAYRLFGGFCDEPSSRAELNPPARELVQRRQVLGQPHGVVEGQLVDHEAEPQDASPARQRGQVDVGGGHRADRGVLVLDEEVSSGTGAARSPPRPSGVWTAVLSRRLVEPPAMTRVQVSLRIP